MPEDIHARVVIEALNSRDDSLAKLIDVRSHQGTAPGSYDDTQFDLIWNRRSRLPPIYRPTAGQPNEEEFFVYDARQAWIDALIEMHGTRAINSLGPSRKLENKAIQIALAKSVGLSVPETVISNHPPDVFQLSAVHKQVIVKSLVQRSYEEPYATYLLDRSLLSDRAITAAPTIYQQYIPGELHYRTVIFGGEEFTFKYQSSLIDSRPDARMRTSRSTFSDDTAERLKAFLGAAGLKMGIFDLKLGTDGTLYFLEVNQQGQFFYLDPLSDVRLIKRFVNYLARTARS